MTYTDAVSRIGQIQDQIASLRTAFVPTASPSAATTGSSASPAASAANPSGAATPANFSTALAGAIGATAPTATAATATPATGATLPARASTMLTSDQQRFAARLASDTGLDPGVVSAWLLAEESGGAAVARQSSDNNDWLNIGYTGGGTFGAGDSVWSDPVSAADATAGWLKGQSTIPGYGTASSGIQAILHTAGQAPSAQITALQGSGWAASGYPSLASLYTQVAG